MLESGLDVEMPRAHTLVWRSDQDAMLWCKSSPSAGRRSWKFKQHSNVTLIGQQNLKRKSKYWPVWDTTSCLPGDSPVLNLFIHHHLPNVWTLSLFKLHNLSFWQKAQKSVFSHVPSENSLDKDSWPLADTAGLKRWHGTKKRSITRTSSSVVGQEIQIH